MNNTILHCDLNNFYASVECLYNPQIRQKPVAVCGSQENRKGIVLAKNYIAKKYRVTTGEPIIDAIQKCPKLIIVPPNYGRYLDFSMEVQKIYAEFTDHIEPFGIDECWLDITHSIQLFGSPFNIAQRIKEKIKQELGVTISVGISFNKIFAKLGSDMKKPDAITEIYQHDFKSKIWHLPVGELLYVGHATKRKLLKCSIFTIGQLANASPKLLKKHLGKWGEILWCFANGLDQAKVSKHHASPLVKSVGNSVTTPKDLKTNHDVKSVLYILAESVAKRLRKHQLKGRVISIGVRDTNLHRISHQKQMVQDTYLASAIAQNAYQLFLDHWLWHEAIRSIGIKISKLQTPSPFTQYSWLENTAKQFELESLEICIDELRERYGHYAVQRGIHLDKSSVKANPSEEHVIFPVSYFKQGG